MNDIYLDNFFDNDYLEEELPDSMFDVYARRFSQDPLVFRSKEVLEINGTLASTFHLVNYDKNVIEMGPREVKEPWYDIEHDESCVDSTFEWYKSYCEGSRKIFPDVPISAPVISDRYCKPVRDYRLQRYFMNNGFSLVDPTYGELASLGDVGRFVSHNPKSEQEVLFDDVKSEEKLFYSYRDFPRNSAYNCVGLQFNPYHPMSQGRIITVEEEENNCFGQYSMNGNVYDFEYNLNSSEYRVHSDVWVPIVGDDGSGRYECFDLISNYDFVDDCILDAKSHRESTTMGSYVVPNTIVEPIFIEPFFTMSQPSKCYSVIGPWKQDKIKGRFARFYVPYITHWIDRIDEDSGYTSVVDVSDFIGEVKENFFSVFDCEDCPYGRRVYRHILDYEERCISEQECHARIEFEKKKQRCKRSHLVNDISFEYNRNYYYRRNKKKKNIGFF